MTSGARRYVAAWIAKFDELHDIFRRFRKSDEVEVALWLRRIIGGDIGNHSVIQSLGDIRHLLVGPTACLIVVKLFVDGRSGLAGEMRKLGCGRHTLFAMAGRANL